MKYEFLDWTEACIKMAPNSNKTLSTETEEKIRFLDFVIGMLSSASGKDLKSFEDFLAQKLSSEAVKKLVKFNLKHDKTGNSSDKFDFRI